LRYIFFAALREEPDPVFRSQADPCYPEDSQQDGCYPDNATLPSRFMCWITGQAGPGQAGPGQPERGGKTPRRRPADLAALDPRAGRPHR
jgi:hypothetical protein